MGMREFIRALKGISLSLVFAVSIWGRNTTQAEDINLSNDQNNAMAMLNYITVLTQEINPRTVAYLWKRHIQI